MLGPPYGSYSRQSREGQGYDLHAFAIDWEAKSAQCPQGHHSTKWTPGHDVSGDPVIRIRFDQATCRVCPMRHVCTSAKEAPRQLTVRPPALHEALAAARQRQETAAFKKQYALRAGVESTLSQGVRRFDLRQSRFIGLTRTHLQQILTATAMNVVRLITWVGIMLVGQHQRRVGPFAQLVPRAR